MKLKVNEDMCIGCGACKSICPDVFEVDENGAKVIVDEISSDLEADAMDAKEGCPVGAIEDIEA